MAAAAAASNALCIWGHFADDEDWTLGGYTKLCDIAKPADIQTFSAAVPLITNAMFYAMKNGVEPLWEDTRNVGAWSYKIHKKFAGAVWAHLLELLLRGALLRGGDGVVNGITISPKRSFCIFKIFVNCYAKIEAASNVPNMDWASGMYKAI